MIISEEVLKSGITPQVLREEVEEAEKKLGRKITVIVGTNEKVSDEEMHKLLPSLEEEVKNHHMKFAALTVVVPGVGMTTLNILLAEYLYEDNACMNFLLKQAKYKLTKINLVD